MENRIEEEGNAFYNDFSSEEIKQTKKISPKALKLLIGTLIAFVSIIIITLIIMSLISSNKNDNLNSLGTITCIYDIKNINEETLILSNDFEKNSKFDIYMENKKIPYSKSYKFSKTGKTEVKFELYEDISLENMFKNILTLTSVKLTSNKNLKILSIESTFENCENLEEFNMQGFNTENIQSMKKTFYKCKQLSKNEGDFNTKNIKDMSFMFAETSITSIDLSKLDMSNVTNMSYMFYKCSSLVNVRVGNINTEKV